MPVKANGETKIGITLFFLTFSGKMVDSAEQHEIDLGGIKCRLNTTVCLLVLPLVASIPMFHVNRRCPNMNIIDLNSSHYMGQNAESSKQYSFFSVLMKYLWQKGICKQCRCMQSPKNTRFINKLMVFS